MATCDPQTLLNDGSCFLCLSEKELNVAVAQLLCDIASGGVPCACENLGGADSPLNNTTPDFIGQVYVQDSGVVWQAGSLLSSSWTVLCDPTGGCNGMIWGPDATELDFFTWGNGTFFTNSTILTLLFPTLATVLADFDFSFDAVLESVSAPMLGLSGGIFGNDCAALNTVNFQSLTTINNGGSGNLDLSTCPNLTEISFPALTTVAGYFYVYDCALTSINLPLLTTIGSGNAFDFSGNNLTYLSLPSLTNGDFYGANNQLTSLDLPLLDSKTFSADNNSLTTLSLPSYTTIIEFTASNNLLTHITAPNLVGEPGPGGGSFGAIIDVSNNALDAATIEFLLHVAVLAGWAVGTTVTLDGGTNAGLASLSIQGQADYATLFGAGVTITINP